MSQWKKEVLERLPEVFSKKPDKEAIDHAHREAELFRKIGQLEMELDWLKKKVLRHSLWVPDGNAKHAI